MYQKISQNVSLISKARHQSSIWVTTHEMVAKLSKRLEISQAEVIHLAIDEMDKFYACIGENTADEKC